MKQLLEYIVPNIVNHPEDVVITEETTPEGTSLMIEVNQEDMGRVIGKSGKVIKSIRQIARVMAIKRGIRIHIDILDKNAPTQPVDVSEPVDESEPVVETEAEEAVEPTTEEVAPIVTEETSTDSE